MPTVAEKLANFDKRLADIERRESELQALRASHNFFTLEDFGIMDGRILNAEAMINLVIKLQQELKQEQT